VASGAKAERWDFPLSRRPGNDLPLTLQDGEQTFALTNDTEIEMLVRIERIAPRTNALTAARAATLPLFRELFPDQRLTPGQLVAVSQITLLVTQLDRMGQLYRDLGDAKAFATIHEHFRLLEEIVKRDGGAVVKTIHAGMMAAFPEPVAAVRAALDMSDALAKAEATRNLSFRAGVHRGPALTATINDRLDYFGITANLAAELPHLGQPGDLILSRAVGSDAQVVELLKAREVHSEIIPITDEADSFAHRIVQVSSDNRGRK
jgi:class 3 adenylate cyclase